VSESYLVVSCWAHFSSSSGDAVWARNPWETTESAVRYRITPVVAPEAGATLFGRPCRRQRTRRTLQVRPRRVLESWHCGWSRCVLHLLREVFESGPGGLKETSVQLHVRRVRPVVAPTACASPPGAARGGRVAELAPELPRQCEKEVFACAGVSWTLRPLGSRCRLETAVHDCSCHARAIIGCQGSSC